MNDTFTLARLVADEVDAEMFRKGYEQGLRDGANKERDACASLCDTQSLYGNADERWSANQCAIAIRKRDNE